MATKDGTDLVRCGGRGMWRERNVISGPLKTKKHSLGKFSLLKICLIFNVISQVKTRLGYSRSIIVIRTLE